MSDVENSREWALMVLALVVNIALAGLVLVGALYSECT